MSGISSSSKEAGEANGAPGTGKSALQSATEFAETVFTPEKWEWLNKLKDQVSEDRGENGGKSAEESSQQQKLDSQPSLTENLFLPEKWEWVVKLNEMTMSDEARRVNNKMKAEKLGVSDILLNPAEKGDWMVISDAKKRDDTEGRSDKVSETPLSQAASAEKKQSPHKSLEEYCLRDVQPPAGFGGMTKSFVEVSAMETTEIEHICSTLLPAVLQDPSEAQPYAEFIKEVFEMDEEEFGDLQWKSEQKLIKDLIVLCNIKGASITPAKGFKSFSELVCHLTVLPSEKAGSSTYSTVSVDWLNSGTVSELSKTNPVSVCMSPNWDQSFQMKLSESSSKDMIVIEVWGKKAKSGGFSVKKAKEYFLNQDNMVGRAFYTLKSTPTYKENKRLQLLSHSGKEDRGTVDVHLSVETAKEYISMDVHIREYKMLLRCIINLEAKKSGSHILSWDERLSRRAESVLMKYVETSGLSQLQERCIRFQVLMEYHKAFQVGMGLLSDHLKDIMSPDSLTMVKNNQNTQMEQLLTDTACLHSMIVQRLNNLFLHFDLKEEKDLNEISHMVRVTRLLYSFPPFLETIPKKDLKEFVEISIQIAMPKWFLKLTEVAGDHSEEELVVLTGICYHCYMYSHRVLKLLNPIFEKISVDYFSTFFVELDKLLYGALMPRVKAAVKTKKHQQQYELYVVFKDLSKLSSNVSMSRRSDLNIVNFYMPFKSKVMSWIDLAEIKCKDKIELTIKLDEEMKIEMDQPYSSSALDTGECLLQLARFWKNLEWPVAVDAVGHLSSVTEKLSDMAMHYVDELYHHSLLTDTSAIYNDKGRFQSSERLCTVLNNMYHVKKTLSDIPSTLGLDKYYMWLNGESEELGEKTKELVERLLLSRNEDIEHKVHILTENIMEKITPDINYYFQVIIPTVQRKETSSVSKDTPFQWPWEKEEEKEKDKKISNEEAISPLLDYLTSNLQVLGQFLFTSILNGILRKLWDIVLQTVKDRIETVSRKPSLVYLYQRLEYGLTELKAFFHAGGKGMPLADIETEFYQSITTKLSLLLLSSKDLILRYLLDLGGQQQQEMNSEDDVPAQGTLHISVGYLDNKQVLEVSVMQARNLPGKAKLSTNVEVCLLPSFVFPKYGKMRHRTPIVKGTAHPVYAKEFIFATKEAELAVSGASLVLYLNNTETSSVIGVATIDGSMVPRLNVHTQSFLTDKMTERKNYSLVLFTPKEMPSWEEIKIRMDAGDLEVTNFCKLHPRLLPNSGLTESNNFDIVNVFDSIGSKLTDLFS